MQYLFVTISMHFVAPGKGATLFHEMGMQGGYFVSRDGDLRQKNYSCFLAICQRFVCKKFHKRLRSFFLSGTTNPSKKNKNGCERETTAV